VSLLAGDCLAAKMHPDNVHSAEDWPELSLPEIERQQRLGNGGGWNCTVRGREGKMEIRAKCSFAAGAWPNLMKIAPICRAFSRCKKFRLTALFFALALAFPQDPAPRSSQATDAAPNTVIRIDVNLVHVDAVITDSRNRRVTDLQAADFEGLQDGKPQAITNFSYVSTKLGGVESASAHRVAQAKPVKGDVPPPPPVLQPTEVRRTLALVVADLGLAAESISPVRDAIQDFIDGKMRPGDLVAIVRTGAGMGALQRFTSDKRLLYAALNRVKYGESRVGVSSFAPLGSGVRGGGAVDHFREETLAVGTLGALRFVVNAMRGFPGRKSVVLFAENIRLIFRGTSDEMVAHAVQQLSDAANRASVVIHAIDPRGMQNYNLTAADNPSRMSPRRAARVPAQRQQEVIHTQECMFALAQETGGLFLKDDNDLAGALRKAAEDSDGYYLIGYHPDANTFENMNGRPRFHKIEVKVKRAGLHVRSRGGFIGEPGGGNQPLEHTREAALNHALQSPSSAGSIHPRLTVVFSNMRQSGSSIKALLYFNPKELKWSSEPDGNYKARIDVAAAAYDENGVALAPIDTTFYLQLNSQRYDEAMKQGMVYGIHFPVNRAGPYLVRAAVRDAATEGSGSADQYVEVPDIESGHLALSGIVFHEPAAQSAPANADLPQGPAPGEDVTGGAARRSFRRGTVLVYDYEIINAKTGASQHPELELQTRLFHDGEQVPAFRTVPATAGGASDAARLTAGGRLSLSRDMTPGEYVLQVIVTDKLAKNKFKTATQSMDFEIEP
jgi:VWFA-related protein